MKTNLILKRAALLAITGVMAAFTLTTHAQNRLITSGTITETGSTYISIATQAALQITGSTTYYTGTNITATGTANTTSNGRSAICILDGASASLTGGTFATTGTGGSAIAIYVFNYSKLNLRDADISTVGTNAHGIDSRNESNVTLSGNINITNDGPGAGGLLVRGTSSITNRVHA